MGKRELPNGWNNIKLKDLIINDNGGTWGTEGTKEEGVLVLRSTNFHKYRNVLDYEHDKNAFRIIPKNHIESKKLLLDDILIERSGGGPNQPVGRVAIIEEKGVGKYCGNFIQRITTKKEIILPRLLLLYLSYFYLTGKTIPLQTNNIQLRNLNYNKYKNIKIFFPESKTEQQKIVDYLDEKFSSIDSIEKEVEEYGKKLDELNKSVIDGFIGKFNDLKVDMGSIVKTTYGLNAKGESEGEYTFIRITDINKNGFVDLTSNNAFVNKDYSEVSNYLLKKGDILLCRTGADSGKIGLFDLNNHKSIHAGYLIKLNFNKEEFINKYIWYFSKSNDYWNQVNLLLSGAAAPHFNAPAFRKIKIPKISINLQKEIVYKLDKQFELIKSTKEVLEKQKVNLKNLRKSILNDVFGGFED